ncbi:helix-turn-helix domain-containing protein [Ktedonospora formicarum]|nr:helix-turn-helix domain-containing protein [Ktedonospora formicarum]
MDRSSLETAATLWYICSTFIAEEEEQKMVRGYRGELDLNNAQQTLCRKHAGAARWAFNYGLRRKQEAYKAGQKTPTAIDLHREINALKPSEP